jgi:hypothetical protein
MASVCKVFDIKVFLKYIMSSLQSVQRFLPLRVPKPIETYKPPDKYDKEVCQVKTSILIKHFYQPSKNDMLIIIPYFSPCNSVRMLQNLLLVKNKLEESKTPFLIIHALFPDSIEMSEHSDTYMTVRTSSYAFLKENLANIAINKFKSMYSKFVILDADIIFGRKAWYDNLSNMLDEYDIVQPYSYFKCLDSNFVNVIASGTSAFANACSLTKKTNPFHGHPGYAIAFTKSFFDTHGYLDKSVIGGGDTLICSLALKKQIFANTRNSATIQYLYNKHLIKEHVKVACMDGTVYHLYHNTDNHRQYTTRYLVLEKYTSEDSPYKSIDDLLYKNEDGVYEWIADIREEMNQTMLDYFYSRHDDEIN